MSGEAHSGAGTTPSQTIGPFFHFGLVLAEGGEAASADAAIRVGGAIRDGDGEPVADAMVETWQASDLGRGEFRRVCTDADGQWSVVIPRPSAVEDPELGVQAPHVDVAIFARGLLKQLTTRIYLADEHEANAADPILGRIDAGRRELLVATPEADGYRLDISLQGERETPFLEF